MRSRKALINTIMGLINEAVIVISSFILPHLVLEMFGSDYNGITSSIAQFLGYVTLFKAGIGGVTKAALYKPLAERDTAAISSIVNATSRFLRRVSLIFLGTLFIFGSAYPFLVKENFDWFFSFSLVIIIGLSTFSQYFFGLTYQLLLFADQRQGFIYMVSAISCIINTILSCIFIKAGFSIHAVKALSAVIYIIQPIVINVYVRRYYKIDKTVPPNNDAIKDKWNCFGLQVANFVNSNTDMMVLTLFTNVFEVSVYGVYHMVTSGIRQILNIFVNGIGAAFGNMFAKNEEETIKTNMLVFEQIVFSISNFAFSVCLVMIVPFVTIYTNHVTDVNYIRYAFAFVSTIAILFTCYRIPYQAIVEAVGHFKQTRNGAFFEAFLNISLSLIMVIRLGLVGVAIGTLAAAIFRTLQYSLYVSGHLIKRSNWILVKRLLTSATTILGVFACHKLLNLSMPANYLEWVIQAVIISLISGSIVAAIEVSLYGKTLKISAQKLLGAMRFKRNKGAGSEK